MSKYNKLPSQELLQELLHYDPIVGTFTWKVRDVRHFKTEHQSKTWNTKYAGKPAGYVKRSGGDLYYLLIGISDNKFMAHRLAWMYINGKEPKDQLDHINGVTADNRIVNLREVDNQANGKNQKLNCRNTSGRVGVSRYHYNKSKWIAIITNDQKQDILGIFDNFDDAVKARERAEKKYNFHSGHGKIIK